MFKTPEMDKVCARDQLICQQKDLSKNLLEQKL